MDPALLVQMLIGALLGISVYLPLATGQLTLATPAFYAVGGTLAALLSTRWPVLGARIDGSFPLPSFLLELALGGALAGLLALLVGRIVLRLQGIYLAIATIALVEIVRVAILNLPFTGGAVGIFGIPQPFPSAAGYLLPALALLLLAGWVCQRLEVMALGRAMAAVREDELAARCMGIDTTQVKLTAFVMSAVLAGGTGVLAAHFLNTWNARQGSFDSAVIMLAFVILGGSRSWLGPVLGGLVLTALPELLRPVGDARLVLFGLVILSGPALFPQGLVTPGLLERLGRLGDPAGRPGAEGSRP
ncbi:branched-chain amino acid ABC transporter permease [Cyanobium sp. Cruz CV13-4-11]|jgi:branched-chain amino acid transport system permease protein|uniref:branched-chain amino acid ABC transporter permease n=1 Tax=unclassified Cyanobium TaxID=2627006 RepID=UPI0020CDCE19|nr:MULTISPECIES: branched-chain amino acid ABC transporter permease [unclassified Cyanobium]MCP9901537.1 branched-chain amino acid ABC transporter permease [Cyanobium sp. Cruz CV11-17]MCP9918656.1 branched-chain amino acid ABC transporter permease [Cyanobium sp. Cruz CV13-4-11]